MESAWRANQQVRSAPLCCTQDDTFVFKSVIFFVLIIGFVFFGVFSVISLTHCYCLVYGYFSGQQIGFVFHNLTFFGPPFQCHFVFIIAHICVFLSIIVFFCVFWSSFLGFKRTKVRF